MVDLNADILIEESRWARLNFETLAETACQSVLEHLGQKGEVEVSILACNDARIAALNADFRGKPQPTNVRVTFVVVAEKMQHAMNDQMGGVMIQTAARLFGLCRTGFIGNGDIAKLDCAVRSSTRADRMRARNLGPPLF